jgi:phosphoribosylanthranilate isomerase
MTWIKICGTTNLEDALVAVQAGADAIGFVFHEESPRNISVEAARDIVAKLPPGIEKVGVFTSKSVEHAVEIGRHAGFGAIQLYLLSVMKEAGSQNVGVRTTGTSGLRVYLAMPITVFLNGDSAARNIKGFATERPVGLVDTLFLDSGTIREPGGTGRTFDWNEAAPAVEKLSQHQKIVIAGGLTPENVGNAIEILKPWGVDVVSGVEARPGKKDPEKVRAFVNAVRAANKPA